MFQSIIDDIKHSYKTGNMITRLIIINVSVYLCTALLGSFLPDFYTELIRFLALPGDPIQLLLKPWTLITHMFIHAGFFHMGWNMLFLYWFGRILGDLLGDHRILPLYFVGGLFGAIGYILSYQILPGIGSQAMGASAAVMAVVVAAGFTAPDYAMRLILLGDVKLKFIVFFIVFMDIVALGSKTNTGGHIAHLAGAFLGGFFVHKLRTGSDILSPIGELMVKIQRWRNGDKPSKIKRDKSPLSVKYKGTSKSHKGDSNRASDQSFQEKLDKILDKIKENGYESLTSEEKEFLFQASKK